jgi:hypothetical protein
VKSNGIPKKHAIPFGQNGNKNDIPESSTQGSGLASLREGFPPINMPPKVAGGIPPSGKDFNGILYELSDQGRWSSAGGGYLFDQTFCDTVGGYPAGAKLLRSDLSGFWLNTKDDNTTAPEVTDGTLTGWIPADNVGITTISNLAKDNVTLTSLQAATETIVLSGTLANSVSIYFPQWNKRWVIVNNCTGNGDLTCRLVGEVTGVKIDNGSSKAIFYAGTDLAYLTSNASLTAHGLVSLSSATDSDSETTAATSKAVKSINDQVAGLNVKTVNNESPDDAGNISISAANIGAIPTTGGTVTGEIKSTALNNFRITAGNRSFFLRYDGNDFYVMKTNAGDPDGIWDNDRPLRIGNDGTVYIEGERPKTTYVTNVRLSGLAIASNNNDDNTYAEAPNGTVVVSALQKGNYMAVKYRYLQYCINGNWQTVEIQ